MIEDTVALLKKADELDTFEGSVSKLDVAQIEDFAGFPMPKDYIYFLLECGFASWLGHSIYGIFDATDSRFPKSYNYSAITQTLRAREFNEQRKFPYFEDSLVIGSDGMGGYYVLIGVKSNEHHKVLWLSFDDDWVVTKKWNSFDLFLTEQLDQGR